MPGDPFELEADRISERVVRGLPATPAPATAPATALQRLSAEISPTEDDGDVAPEEEQTPGEGETAMRLSAHPGQSPAAHAIPPVEARLAAGSSTGRALRSDVAETLGTRMGADLRSVRIHDDAAAAELATDLRARAFTWRQEVYFGAGEYRPDSREGLRVLAHELVHAVQQGGAG
jgi:hypothetical protein